MSKATVSARKAALLFPAAVFAGLSLFQIACSNSPAPKAAPSGGGARPASAPAGQAPSASGVGYSGLNEFGNPFKHAPKATEAAITPEDLRTRLYIYSDDSMMGRMRGQAGNMRATAYIASELAKLGLKPGGDNGTYFQNLGWIQRKYTDKSTLVANGKALAWNKDFVAVPTASAAKSIDNAQVIYGGVAGDTLNTITAAQAAGKVVLLSANPNARGGGGGGRGGRGGGFGGAGGGASPFPNAVAVVTADLDALSMAARIQLNDPSAAQTGGGGRGGAAAPPPPTTPPPAVTGVIRVTTAAATTMMGGSFTGLKAGALGKTVTGKLAFTAEVSNYARNVIGIIPGSDPVLKNTYVAIGAHNDHIGYTSNPVNHDSVKALWHAQTYAQLDGTENMKNLTVDIAGSIKANMDSVRKIHPVARLDSISNGADDDGSGSMGILEIAENIQKMPVKPKRSIIFVWHTGEEGGMIGSGYFVSHPTVPLDSIVAQINIDMIGRGREGDLPGGGPQYLGAVGRRFISNDLGDVVDNVNKKQPHPFKLDFRFDTNNTWGNNYRSIYTRSDHYSYAKMGIPIVFFFTGLHGDYHKVTDEAQYIDYPHYSAIANYARDLAIELGNGPRPRKNGTGDTSNTGAAGGGRAGGAGGAPPAAGAAGAGGAAGGGRGGRGGGGGG